MKTYFKQLHWQIFISMILGLLVGYIFSIKYITIPFINTVIILPSLLNIDSPLYSLFVTFGIIFIKLLKMITIPLIFTSILTGITSISSFNKLGRIGLKTISYYLLTSLFAIIIGLGLTNTLKPGNSYT